MHSATAETSADELLAQLAARDELVAALTAQLEETAEKLDRLQRSSFERLDQRNGSTAHRASDLNSQLEEALDAWQELQPAERLQRIEDGVEQILSLLSNGPQATDSRSNGGPESALDYWQAAKAQLLGESTEAKEAEQGSPTVDHATTNGDSRDKGTDRSGTNDSLADDACPVLTEPDAPQPVPEDADCEQLWKGIEERETYLQYLTSRVRHAEGRRYMPVPWTELQQAPEELQRRLQELERQLTDHLKQSEIANSLERAALTRERAKLFQVKQQLEKQVRQLQMSAATAPPEDDAAGDRKERRWNRFFS